VPVGSPQSLSYRVLMLPFTPTKFAIVLGPAPAYFRPAVQADGEAAAATAAVEVEFVRGLESHVPSSFLWSIFALTFRLLPLLQVFPKYRSFEHLPSLGDRICEQSSLGADVPATRLSANILA
jgi:hypothetical protein